MVFSKLNRKIGRVYGLFVGIETFRDSAIPALSFSVDDAEGLWEAFGGEHNSNLDLLVDQEATRENIFGRLSEKMRAVNPGDLLVVFIGGHGTIELDEYFFIPHDFKSGARGALLTGISAGILINGLSTLAKQGSHVLLLLDTCHSGAIPFDISRYQGVNGGGMSCLFSCNPLEVSYETFFDDESGKVTGENQQKKGNGVFSYYLIKGLQGAADTTGDGTIRLRELFNYVYQNVKTFQNGQQHPFLNGTLDGDVVLKRL